MEEAQSKILELSVHASNLIVSGFGDELNVRIQELHETLFSDLNSLKKAEAEGNSKEDIEGARKYLEDVCSVSIEKALSIERMRLVSKRLKTVEELNAYFEKNRKMETGFWLHFRDELEVAGADRKD